MATKGAIVYFTGNTLVVGGNDHSVKLSSHSEMGTGTAYVFLVLSDNS